LNLLSFHCRPQCWGGQEVQQGVKLDCLSSTASDTRSCFRTTTMTEAPDVGREEGLARKAGSGVPRYVILGACNPPLAHEALKQEFNLGLLLPCNAIVYEKDGQTWAGTVDAAKMLSVVGNPEMNPMAEDVNRKLRCTVDSTSSS